MKARPCTVVIENVSPLVDAGRYPIKRTVGEQVEVHADIFKEGHDVMSAVLKWRKTGAKRWHETVMECTDPWNGDHWRGIFTVLEMGQHDFTIEAWGDTWKSWQHEWHMKFDARQPDLKSETLEGAGIIEKAARLAALRKNKADAEWLRRTAKEIKRSVPEHVNDLVHDSELDALMWLHGDRSVSTEFVLAFAETQELIPETAKPDLRHPRIWVDRERAGFSAWYEFFPRSAEGHADRGSTFRECLGRVDDARSMGFDVIYFPPIHPVGITARKGRNNSVSCEPGEPGVPYAIGNRHQDCPNGGGHRDVAPELGTLENFNWLVGEIHARGMEVAIDFAINCSPDHPYVHEHPEWFFKRPDGTIKYAENPPKKYQDVYPLNFHNPTWRKLWDELTGVIEFWCEHGVRIFRVDNPHTKPVHFWEYLIGRVQRQFPDAIFLSEAFTRPKMMRALAKVGFTHSYTYFTWRNTKQGITEYFTDLMQSPSAEYMRGNLWPNTPDILPSYLQFGGRDAFLVRAILSATLAPVYGIYSGFELCENAGVGPNPWKPESDVRRFLELCDGDYKQLAREEYLDSEKYQFKGRDWNAPGNIKSVITRLNRIRSENPALQRARNLHFQNADNEFVLAYSKSEGGNHLLIIVNLNAWYTEESSVLVPLEEFGLREDQQYEVEDLLTGERYQWQGRRNFVRFVHGKTPGHVLRLVT
ncbi:MAG: alpha-1,4-glucan--maltose-1-phosphate maltosyltransferase [Chthoniobacteraceae bacterium]